MVLKKILPIWIKVILTFATIHLLLDLLYAIQQRSLEPINLFSVIDLDLFYPESSKGVLSNLLSIVFVAVAFIFYYLRSKSKK